MPSLEFRRVLDRKSTRLNSSHTIISYAVFCLKKSTQHRPAPPRPHTLTYRRRAAPPPARAAPGVLAQGSASQDQRDVVELGFVSFFFNDTATTEIYTLSLHDALPI